MRVSTKFFLVLGLVLTISTPVGAVVSVGLVQVGGTYSATVGASAGDTLVLEITYSLGPGDAVTLIDPAVVWDDAVSSYDAAGSTETGAAFFTNGDVVFNPIVTGDDLLYPPPPGTENLANGWEKQSNFAGAATNPCVSGACSSMGTAAFVLSGAGGVISIGGVGLPGGTLIGDADYQDATGLASLGTFAIPGPTTVNATPEPSAALVFAMGAGLVGTAVRWRRA
jgi:hypothetical protein